MALRAGAAFVDVLANLAPLKAQMATGLQGTFGKSGAGAAKSFSQGLKGGLKSSLNNLGAGIPKGGLGPLLGIGVAGGLAAGIKEAADQTAALAEEVEDLSEVTGASAQDASELAAVMRAMGVDINTATRPFLNLSKVLEAGGKQLKGFFTEHELAALRSGTLSEAVTTLSQKFRTLEGQQEQNNFLVAAFGTRGAVAMRELLEATDGEIEKAIELAEAQGLIFSQEQLDAARDYRIAMRQLGDSWTGLKTKVGNAAIPALTDVTNNLNFVAGAAAGVQKEIDKLPSGMQKAIDVVQTATGIGKTGIDRIPLVGVLRSLFGDDGDEVAEEAKKAAEEVDLFARNLDELKATANDTSEEGKAAAKRLTEAYTSGFELAGKAAEAFQERLEGLVPALGETFEGILTPSEVTDAVKDASDAVADATDKVADAERRLAETREKVAENQAYLNRTPDRERELADARKDVADAERDLAEAHRDVADAQKDLDAAGTAFEDALSTDELKKTLQTNTGLLEEFVNGIGSVRDRLTENGGGLDEVEEAFLGHLADLGPAAIPLLKDLSQVSDKELANLAGVFGDQIKAAKAAADLEFDKFPANFTEKIKAARDAAANELGNLTEQIEALPENADLSQWEDKMDDLALAFQAMADSGLLTLSEVEQGLLDTALATDDPIAQITALKQLLASLEGKTVKINIETGLPEGFVPTSPGAADLLFGGGQLEDRHSGGSVTAGTPYKVLPNEEIFVPSEDGEVVRKSAPGYSRTSNQTINVGKVVARDFNDFERQMAQKQRMASLRGSY